GFARGGKHPSLQPALCCVENKTRAKRRRRSIGEGSIAVGGPVTSPPQFCLSDSTCTLATFSSVQCFHFMNPQPPLLSTQMHEVDFKVHGDDMQFVEIELDPQEAVVAEAGGMMFMDDGIAIETIFGDGG